jgi:hypothetical protein
MQDLSVFNDLFAKRRLDVYVCLRFSKSKGYPYKGANYSLRDSYAPLRFSSKEGKMFEFTPKDKEGRLERVFGIKEEKPKTLPPLVQIVHNGQFVQMGGTNWFRVVSKKIGYFAEIDSQGKDITPMRAINKWEEKITKVANKLPVTTTPPVSIPVKLENNKPIKIELAPSPFTAKRRFSNLRFA